MLVTVQGVLINRTFGAAVSHDTSHVSAVSTSQLERTGLTAQYCEGDVVIMSTNFLTSHEKQKANSLQSVCSVCQMTSPHYFRAGM